MFYDNYIRLCNSVNKTPSAVAIEIGISKTSVNRWKNGSYPTDATMQRIANFFNVTVDELNGRGQNENTAIVDGVGLDHLNQQKTPTPENESERNIDDLIEQIKRADDQTLEMIRRVVGYK